MQADQAERPLVLITGASGSVGSCLRPFLRQHYRLRLHYRQHPPADLSPDEEIVTAEITDLDALEGIVQGASAVVHLAGQAQVGASWEAVRGPNIDGVYALFEAARRAGVGKVVFASTNHVTGMYDRTQLWPIRAGQLVRPDSYYGASKAFGEALASYYADAFGLSVICLRIGWVLARPHNEQSLRIWLSPRDLGQLVHCSLEAQVRFGVYYGVSNNARNKWDLSAARVELGYHPRDDSELYAAEILGG